MPFDEGGSFSDVQPDPFTSDLPGLDQPPGSGSTGSTGTVSTGFDLFGNVITTVGAFASAREARRAAEATAEAAVEIARIRAQIAASSQSDGDSRLPFFIGGSPGGPGMNLSDISGAPPRADAIVPRRDSTTLLGGVGRNQLIILGVVLLAVFAFNR